MTPHACARTPHLFADWEDSAQQLRAAAKIYLFLDFDGTLAPIQPLPEMSRLSRAEQNLLARIARLTPTWIVSGRCLTDLRRRATIPGVELLGSHGLPMPVEGARPSPLRVMLARLSPMLEGLAGIWIEDKGACIAIHYRQATPSSSRAAARIVNRLVPPRLKLVHGKKVWEAMPLRPNGKGGAVLNILRDAPAHTVPVYLGDDTGDETAFEALSKWRRGVGLSVCVGRNRATAARRSLRDPSETWEFLRRLEALLS